MLSLHWEEEWREQDKCLYNILKKEDRNISSTTRHRKQNSTGPNLLTCVTMYDMAVSLNTFKSKLNKKYFCYHLLVLR